MCAASTGRTHGSTDQPRSTPKQPLPTESRPHMAMGRLLKRTRERPQCDRKPDALKPARGTGWSAGAPGVDEEDPDRGASVRMPEGRSRIGERASWRYTLREWGEVAAASSSCHVGHRDELWSSGMTRLDGKTALITGSTDGVGHVVAKRLGEAGARVLVHGRNQQCRHRYRRLGRAADERRRARATLCRQLSRRVPTNPSPAAADQAERTGPAS